MENMTAQQLTRAITAGTVAFYVINNSELYCERVLNQAMTRFSGLSLPYVWTCTSGLKQGELVVPDTVDPLKALDYIMELPGPTALILKDIPNFWRDNPFLVRKLKDSVVASNGKRKVIFIMGEEQWIPQSLRENLTVMTLGLPGIEEIKNFLGQLVKLDTALAKACQDDPFLFENLTLAARGLDLVELERAVRLLQLREKTDGVSPVGELLETKRRIIQQSGIMELVLDITGCDQIGGMENLKQWLDRRKKAFGLESISAGIGLPRGVLVMGIAGCGKSLFVKSIAAEWHMPLLRLDMATVYGGLFGTPESSLHLAFATAEAVAPCVLWIDEIESGITTHGFKSEGGSASRVLGLFLTWMQEKKAAVFVAATANAIEMLPAEVLRKGRFDEIFYVGLPDAGAREQIFRIFITNAQINSDLFDISLLAGSTKGFSGAEIEQAVNSAVFEALAERRPMTQRDMLTMISRTVPLSVTMAEQIKKIEAWAFKRAVPATGKFN